MKRRKDRWLWSALVVVGAIGSAALAGATDVVNSRGFSQFADFFKAALSPALDSETLRVAAEETLVTVNYAVLGTALSLTIGILGGALLSETAWEPLARRWSVSRRLGWRVVRGIAAIPRSVHEVVWGIILLNIMGNDPWVAVLAIGIPFGSVTAKVFAEIMDETPRNAYESLRASGASRLSSLWYGVLPDSAGDLLSYSFYRLECAIRSAAILGVIGAGGLGFQLRLSFINLNYNEMWTFLYALILLSGLADWWSSAVRKRHAQVGDSVESVDIGASPGRDRLLVGSSIALAVAIPFSWMTLGIRLRDLWSSETLSRGSEFVADAFPPDFGGTNGGLVGASIDTVAMAILALAIAFGPAILLGFLASRPRGHTNIHGRCVRAALSLGRLGVRMFLLVLRAVPPPIGAFIALFLFFPGIWPGAVALGVYNLGVTGRLLGEVVENRDTDSEDLLRSQGVGRLSRLAYATAPTVTGRFISVGFYRWEVAIRDTVVVGVVGAAGLGRVIADQRVSFDYNGMTATIVALIVLTIAADQLSAAMRRSFR
ncbi:MAG: PhnE/PtxC family ABC transporter permease [Acidimicrobiales bacterium]